MRNNSYPINSAEFCPLCGAYISELGDCYGCHWINPLTDGNGYPVDFEFPCYNAGREEES